MLELARRDRCGDTYTRLLQFVVSLEFFVPVIQFLHEGLSDKQSFFQLARI
jgi:hypothetical protein